MVINTDKQNVTPEFHASALNGKRMEETEKSWERPWSTNEIRQNSDNWTLAGDVGLLNHLQEFSHQLISRTHEMEKVVDGLVHQSKETCAKVNNVINDFQMLSNLKFVENRVYDEGIVDTTKNIKEDVQPKSKEQNETEMVSRVKQALDLGLSVLDKAFDRVYVDDTSDSEEEELTQELEPKDLYEHRPLPFVIGSEEFQRDDYAGLRYMVEEEPLLEVSAQDDYVSISEDSTESESEEELEFEAKEPVHIEKPPSSSLGAFFPEKKEIPQENHKGKLSDSDGSDLFGDEENGYVSTSSVDEPPKETKKSKNEFLAELGSKITKPVQQPVVADKPILKEQPNNPVKPDVKEKAEESDDLFDNDDGFDNDSLFGKNKGLFASESRFGSKNEDMFNDDFFEKSERKPSMKKEEPKKNTAVKKKEDSESLFDDDDEDHDLFGSFSSSIPTEPKPKRSTSKVKTSKSSENVTKPAASPVTSTKGSTKSFSMVPETSDSLFDLDLDNDDLFSDIKTTTQSKGAFDFANDDEDELFGSSTLKDKKSSTPQAKEKSRPKASKEPPSLFDDNDEFDLFGPDSPVKKAESKPKKVEAPAQSVVEKKDSLSIFDESLSIDLFAPANPKAATKIESLKDVEPESSVVNDVITSIAVTKENPPPPKPNNVSKVKQPLLMDNQMKPVIDIGVSTENQEISFDKPVDSISTLSALNKDRAKIQVKRRKPTRKGRQGVQISDNESSQISNTEKEKHEKKPSVASITNSDDLFSSIDTSAELKPKPKVPSVTNADDLFVSTESNPVRPKPTALAHKTKEKETKNLMSQLISEAATSRIGKRNSFLGDHNDDDDIFSKDIANDKTDLGSDFSFESPSLKSDVLAQAKGVPEKVSKEDSILSFDSSLDDDLFSRPSTTGVQKSNARISFSLDDDDDDDNIFKSEKNKDIKSQGSDDIFADASDDIFANMDDDYEIFPKSQFEDDEDDIFSNLDKPNKPTSAKESKPAAQKKEEKPVDIFDDPLGGLSLNN